ncbi:hypothetical protein AG1IA_06087 [Rhizoctonia solani AG-1 IA]|uniref:Uncharacterized protein n=1 Tax=Thanatephorus cucumeris (strain AG1-IA) TaxID=983506 RepID=L8WPG5_THACA|nr:hypothetical protein AG1IA_06087 [Rhizoctonia solani AG-1 IA]
MPMVSTTVVNSMLAALVMRISTIAVVMLRTILNPALFLLCLTRMGASTPMRTMPIHQPGRLRDRPRHPIVHSREFIFDMSLEPLCRYEHSSPTRPALNM